MRVWNWTVSRIFPAIFLLMSLAVATREIPELYKLMDDPSNDGQIFDWQSQPALRTTHCLRNSEEIPTARIITFSWYESFTCASIVPAGAARSILRLVCLLRT